MSTQSILPKKSVLVVGAGEFGATTTLSLLRTGKYDVKLVDRAPVLPAEDAASTDINKVVRFDYADQEYAKLAFEAIKKWEGEDWRGIYHGCGVVVTGPSPDGPHGQACLPFLSSLYPVKELDSHAEMNTYLDPKGTGVSGKEPGAWAYHNPKGGWAHASAAIEKVYSMITSEFGVEPIPGVEMKELIFDEVDGTSLEKVKGIRTVDGREFLADETLLCTGSWTTHLLGDSLPKNLVISTGQVLAGFQLEGEEWERYKDVPVIMSNDETGFYCFPPNSTGLMKFANHHDGYLSADGRPRTTLTPGAQEYHDEHKLTWLPKFSDSIIRAKVAIHYPELAERPWDFTRMCWYSDVVDGNWIIDHHPKYKNLFVAAGGSGHAFKMLPVMGDLILARFEDRLPAHLATKFSIVDRAGQINHDRIKGGPQPLRMEDFVPAQAGGNHVISRG